MKEEQKLITKAKAGDINSFHQLFAEFQQQLKSYLYRLTANRNDADDLTHDTFVRSFDKLFSFKGESNLKTWVFRIGTNLAFDLLRKRKLWPVDAQDQSRAVSKSSPEVQKAYKYINENSPEGAYEILEHIDFCFTCISKTLPAEQQVGLILKDVYSFKQKEIAEILDTTISRVKHMLHSARETMTGIFDNRCSLINKSGACYQCTELNGLFNPKQNEQEQLVNIEMVNSHEVEDSKVLFEMRTKLVSSIDPLNAKGTELHDFIMQRVRTVIGDAGKLE